MRRFTNLLVLAAVLVGFFYFYGRPWNDQPKADPTAGQTGATAVTWYVVGSSEARDHIYASFEDERGWQQSGVDFQEKPRAFGHADIVIIMFDARTENPCRSRNTALTACARGVGSALTSFGCVIYIPGGYEKTEVMTGFVNHEAGHCLGLGHLDKGLMRPNFQRNVFNNVIDGPFWPTDPELELLRRRLR